MAHKGEIRPIYSQLQGYLSQAPAEESLHQSIYDSVLWEEYNSTIDELESVCHKGYEKFKIKPILGGREDLHFGLVAYRTKLAGLISRLHGEYFSDEQPPFSGMPSTQINVAQEQSQSLQVEIVYEITTRICEMLPKYEPGTPERTFLEKVKDSLKTVKNASALITLILQTAKECGVPLDVLASMFG